MAALVRYDAMCSAIEAAYQVDEVKDIRDQALALETYYGSKHWPSLLAPNCSGVYIFVGMPTVLYVGEARHLRRRLLNHSRGYLRRQVGVELRILPCRNHKQVEAWLIAALHPVLNGVSEERRHCTPRKNTEEIFAFVDELRMFVDELPMHSKRGDANASADLAEWITPWLNDDDEGAR